MSAVGCWVVKKLVVGVRTDTASCVCETFLNSQPRLCDRRWSQGIALLVDYDIDVFCRLPVEKIAAIGRKQVLLARSKMWSA